MHKREDENDNDNEHENEHVNLNENENEEQGEDEDECVRCLHYWLRDLSCELPSVRGGVGAVIVRCCTWTTRRCKCT